METSWECAGCFNASALRHLVSFPDVSVDHWSAATPKLDKIDWTSKASVAKLKKWKEQYILRREAQQVEGTVHSPSISIGARICAGTPHRSTNSSTTMKISLTLLLASAHGVLAFWRMPIHFKTGVARIDPIVTPGGVADHAHVVFGGGSKL